MAPLSLRGRKNTLCGKRRKGGSRVNGGGGKPVPRNRSRLYLFRRDVVFLGVTLNQYV